MEQYIAPVPALGGVTASRKNRTRRIRGRTARPAFLS